MRLGDYLDACVIEVSCAEATRAVSVWQCGMSDDMVVDSSTDEIGSN